MIATRRLGRVPLVIGLAASPLAQGHFRAGFPRDKILQLRLKVGDALATAGGALVR